MICFMGFCFEGYSIVELIGFLVENSFYYSLYANFRKLSSSFTLK